MSNLNYIYDDPKQVLKSLKIHKSLIQKQLKFLPYSLSGIRQHLRTHLALVEANINDYEEFFKQKKEKYLQTKLFEENKLF